MPFVKKDSVNRADFGTVTNTPLTRGLLLNGKQVEMISVTKATGDTTAASLALSSVQRPVEVIAVPVNDSAGAAITSINPVAVTFSRTNDSTIALSGLGDWTAAMLLVTGRAYN
jgi:hypothetical protein